MHDLQAAHIIKILIFFPRVEQFFNAPLNQQTVRGRNLPMSFFNITLQIPRIYEMFYFQTIAAHICTPVLVPFWNSKHFAKLTRHLVLRVACNLQLRVPIVKELSLWLKLQGVQFLSAHCLRIFTEFHDLLTFWQLGVTCLHLKHWT